MEAVSMGSPSEEEGARGEEKGEAEMEVDSEEEVNWWEADRKQHVSFDQRLSKERGCG